MKLTNLRDKEKILRAARDKRSVTYNGRNIRLAAYLYTETWQARKDWQNIFGALNEKNMKPRISYPARKSFKNRRRDKKLPGQTETKRICDHQTSPMRNIERGPLSKQRAPK